ncbi:MAG: conjugal transfer protein TraX, partial [Oscillospiraceae bacterium]|nr:conjugal transfer protein TraX [Oscillospiraceae bacterium]
MNIVAKIKELSKNHGITQNHLKVIAAVLMLIDHVGAELFPQLDILRVIGRLSFPIFAFFIYEGCKYTRSKPKYLMRIFILGLLCI